MARGVSADAANREPRTEAAKITFAGVLAGCATAFALVILMVRFPLLLVAVLLACWIFSRLQGSAR